MRFSILLSALVAVLVGFGGSVAIVIAAAEAVNATQAETSSWIAMLCISMAVTATSLSVLTKMPVVTAWSTPGAALIATTAGISLDVAAGAFLVAALLILLTAFFRPLGTLVQKIPTPVATAILAGVLFPFVVGAVEGVSEHPWLGLPMVVVFAVLRRYSPAWAVVAVLAVGVALSYTLDLAAAAPPLAWSVLVWVTPAFDLQAIIGLALPLYLVTMASQNLPGFAVLKAAGYEPPTQKALGITGLASVASAFAGAHTTSLAAITASICTGPDVHPDKAKRWLTGPIYGLGYGLLALGAASVVALFDSFPPALVALVAGIALLGPFVNSIAQSFPKDGDHFAPAVAFVVTAAGIPFLGIGAAFWGLVLGLVLTVLEKKRA